VIRRQPCSSRSGAPAPTCSPGSGRRSAVRDDVSYGTSLRRSDGHGHRARGPAIARPPQVWLDPTGVWCRVLTREKLPERVRAHRRRGPPHRAPKRGPPRAGSRPCPHRQEGRIWDAAGSCAVLGPLRRRSTPASTTPLFDPDALRRCLLTTWRGITLPRLRSVPPPPRTSPSSGALCNLYLLRSRGRAPGNVEAGRRHGPPAGQPSILAASLQPPLSIVRVGGPAPAGFAPGARPAEPSQATDANRRSSSSSCCGSIPRPRRGPRRVARPPRAVFARFPRTVGQVAVITWNNPARALLAHPCPAPRRVRPVVRAFGPPG